MTDETTSKQLAEIEGQGESTPATEYTPPKGWRVLAVGERLRDGDVTVRRDGYQYPTERVGGWVGSNQRYIRPIEPQPEQKPQAEAEPQPETQPQPIQVREGLWRQADGGAVAVRPTIDSPSNSRKRDRGYVWSDGARLYLDNGRHNEHETTQFDLVEYLGPIQQQLEPQPVPIQVREGRWKTRAGEIVSVSAMPTDDDNFSDAYPWWDGDVTTWANNGVFFNGYTAGKDLVEYLGPIEQQPEPQPEPEKLPEGCRNDGGWSSVNGIEPEPWPVPQPPVPQDADQMIRLLSEANHNHVAMIGRLQAAINERAELGGADQTRAELQGRIRELEAIRDTQAATIEELRSEVSYVQRMLSESRQRVTHLEQLVASLRTINAAQEKTVRLAGQENTDLQHRLNVVSAELVEQFETVRKLRIELDAAQQVPQAVSDRFEEGWDAGTARAVETVLEWLQPIRAVDNEHLANETLQHLPQIMRHLTGLAQD